MKSKPARKAHSRPAIPVVDADRRREGVVDAQRHPNSPLTPPEGRAHPNGLRPPARRPHQAPRLVYMSARIVLPVLSARLGPPVRSAIRVHGATLEPARARSSVG